MDSCLWRHFCDFFWLLHELADLGNAGISEWRCQIKACVTCLHHAMSVGTEKLTPASTLRSLLLVMSLPDQMVAPRREKRGVKKRGGGWEVCLWLRLVFAAYSGDTPVSHLDTWHDQESQRVPTCCPALCSRVGYCCRSPSLEHTCFCACLQRTCYLICHAWLPRPPDIVGTYCNF